MADQNPQINITRKMLKNAKRAKVDIDQFKQLKDFVSSSVTDSFVDQVMSGAKEVKRAVLFLNRRQRDGRLSELRKRSATLYIRDSAKEAAIFNKLCKIVKKKGFKSAEPNLKTLWTAAKEKEGDRYTDDDNVVQGTPTGEFVFKYVKLVIFPEVIVYKLQMFGKTHSQALFCLDLQKEKEAFRAKMNAN